MAPPIGPALKTQILSERSPLSAFLEAAGKGDVARVIAMAATRCRSISPPLDQAALDGRTDIAQLLMTRGAQIRMPAAVALDRAGDIERLMRDEPNALKPGERFGTLIIRAAAASPGPVVERLIELGADVNAVDDEKTSIDGDSKYDGTPAGWARYAGHTHIRDVILRGPIDIIQAIEFDLVERIPLILKADPHALDRRFRRHTLLEWAKKAGTLEAVTLLEEQQRLR